MKRLIILFTLLLIISNITNAQFDREHIKSIKKSLPRGLSMKVDQMEGVIWITSKKILTRLSQEGNYIQFYFAISELGKIGPLRIVNSITTDSWVFMNKATYLVGGSKMNKDGTQKRFEISLGDVYRNVNTSGSVTEKSDVSCSDDIIEFMKYQIEKRAFITIRYSGKESYIERPIFGGKAANIFAIALNAHEAYKKDRNSDQE